MFRFNDLLDNLAVFYVAKDQVKKEVEDLDMEFDSFKTDSSVSSQSDKEDFPNLNQSSPEPGKKAAL